MFIFILIKAQVHAEETNHHAAAIFSCDQFRCFEDVKISSGKTMAKAHELPKLIHSAKVVCQNAG